MTTAKEYVEKYTELGNKYKALETKHKNLRACVSGMTQQLRELDGPWDKELECKGSWPEVPSFGIYMQLLQALMGAVPPVVGGETDTTIAIKEQKYTDRKKFKGNGNRYK